MARYKLIIEYDGTDFLGFQRQAVGRTVQSEFEAALNHIGWMGKSIVGAGRTDTGVHARGQAIAFDLEWKHGEGDLLRALNANLPQDIAVKSVVECAPDFHPRFSARGRRYRYTIYNAPVRSPLFARSTWHLWPPALNVEAMQAASRLLVGQQDFAAFGADPEGGENTVRTIEQAKWSAILGTFVYFDIQANAFLYRMVRSLVGALKCVGASELTVEAFKEILRSRDRSKCPPLAPPQGLCLMEVLY